MPPPMPPPTTTQPFPAMSPTATPATSRPTSLPPQDDDDAMSDSSATAEPKNVAERADLIRAELEAVAEQAAVTATLIKDFVKASVRH